MKRIVNGAGFYSYSGPDAPGGRVEGDFLTCGHCQQGMILTAWRTAGAMCMVCERPICTNCHGRTTKFGCEIVERSLTEKLNEHYRREQNARILGI